MMQVLGERTIEQPPQEARHADRFEIGGRAESDPSTQPLLLADAWEARRVRLPLAARSALRDAVGYAIETQEGEIGVVTGVRFAPFEYWPHELLVTGTDGSIMRVPVSDIATVLPREGRLWLSRIPAGAQPAPRPRKRWLAPAGIWRAVAAAGGLLGLGGFVATFVALVVDADISWAPALAVTGAAGGSASALAWRNGCRSWLAALGLGAFWLPLLPGTILTLVLIFR